MSSRQREKFNVERDCMEACITALDTLGKRHYKDDGDSVAEAQAKRAQGRVLQWLVSYYELGGAR